jgi:hypothetical protein
MTLSENMTIFTGDSDGDGRRLFLFQGREEHEGPSETGECALTLLCVILLRHCFHEADIK